MRTRKTKATAPDTPLSIPKELWSRPDAEAARCVPTPARLSLVTKLLPLGALVSAYLSALTSTAGHDTVGGVLLFLAAAALVAFASSVARFSYRTMQYRRAEVGR